MLSFESRGTYLALLKFDSSLETGLSMLTSKFFHGMSLCLALMLCTHSAFAEDVDSDGIRFYESKIRPLLLEHCADCHGAETQESDLRLDTPGHINLGGQSGPVVIPLKPEQSLLISALSHEDEALSMPPDEKLPAADIKLLTQWVSMGAPLPDAEVIAARQRIPFDLEEARKHWSFAPLQESETPSKENENPIDLFILSKLTERGLTPAQPASKAVLIRRAYLDLIGLPPTPEQVDRFLADKSPTAFEKVVDELLASPHYGERWGRHWLDVARYADSNGLDENVAHGSAWRYRDYVIAAFNSDKPFNEFIQEQIAGDLLNGDAHPSHEQLIATGFLSMGPKVLAEGDETKMQMDIIDEQIDTTGRAFLGLTLGCARCHDHKFDPIRADDYYALAGIFKSTKTMESLKRIAKWNEHVIASPEQLKEKEHHDQEVASVQSKIDELKKQQTENKTVSVDATGEKESSESPPSAKELPVAEQLKALDQQLKELKGATPELPTAMGVVEGEAKDVPIHVRGSHLSLGRDVARGVPLVLSQGDPALQNPQQSGRLELANWLTSKENPLTARVWVNRVWRWHFGKGIVSTTNNFGLLGTEPTHPELLDWLAMEFMKNGWSTKQLHRQMMLSKTYQMSSAYNKQNSEIDPENRFLWRRDQQRMEAEVFRDSVLAASGQLDRSMGGSMLHVKNREFIFNHTSKDETNYATTRRSVYLPVIRNNLYVGFSLFDYTDASVPNGDRSTSTVAPQALYALNSDLVLTAAEKLAERLFEQHADDFEPRVQSLYMISFGRDATPSEVEAVQAYLQSFATPATKTEESATQNLKAWTALCQAFLISNEFIYVQ